MTDRYNEEIDITEFDQQDGLMPASLRSVFIPDEELQIEETDPPAWAQALGALSLVVFPIWFDLAAGIL